MFTTPQIYALSNILFYQRIVLTFDTYVYVEDSHEFVNLHLRKWDRSDGDGLAREKVVHVLVEKYSFFEINFHVPLFSAAIEDLGLE